jgi:hypothetical protein
MRMSVIELKCLQKTEGVAFSGEHFRHRKEGQTRQEMRHVVGEEEEEEEEKRLNVAVGVKQACVWVGIIQIYYCNLVEFFVRIQDV